MNEFKLYPCSENPMKLMPGHVARDWMTTHAYRCLPMVVANQFGWDVVLDHDVTGEWNGGLEKEDVTIAEGKSARSSFGLGTITFDVGYVWHAPCQLLVCPVPNRDDRHFESLTAIVEADHFAYPWFATVKLTAPGPFRLAAGTRICRVMPLDMKYSRDAKLVVERDEPGPYREFREAMGAERDASDKPWIRKYHESVEYANPKFPKVHVEDDPIKRLAKMGIHVVENFFDGDYCHKLITHWNSNVAAKTDDSWDGRTVWAKWAEYDDVRWMVQQECDSFFEREPHERESFPLNAKATDLHLVRWPTGTVMEAHEDGAGGRYPGRDYSAVVYLNDDYEGGDVYFPELGVEFLPDRGTLVLFRGGSVMHGVKEVTKGDRYTAICWLKGNY